MKEVKLSYGTEIMIETVVASSNMVDDEVVEKILKDIDVETLTEKNHPRVARFRYKGNNWKFWVYVYDSYIDLIFDLHSM